MSGPRGAGAVRPSIARRLAIVANGSHTFALSSTPHSSLGACQRPSERWLERSGLVLDHDARKTTQDDLDAAPYIDAPARTVDVAQPDRNALDGLGVSSELLSQPSSDILPVTIIKRDTIDPDMGGNPWLPRSVSRALQRFGHVLHEWFSLLGHGEP